MPKALSFVVALPPQAIVDDINDLFVVARDEIADAVEDKDTTYFNDGVESAGAAVDAVMQKWEVLLSQVRGGRCDS
ncbi:MAG: hypothetical protein WDW38_001580 [Sanguina aurantia]